MSKCPVCDWDIKEKPVRVKVGGKEILVCCQECADKLRQQSRSKR